MKACAGALLALWNDVTPSREDEYNDWHALEHVPERLTMPGFLWAQRWRATTDGGPGPQYLTLYGLTRLDALDTAAYQRLLAGPTPWSQRMRPHLLRLSRWACAVHAGGEPAVKDGLQVVCLSSRPTATVPETLVAHRQQHTAPLPWLAGGQSSEVPGEWLACAPHLAHLPGEVYRRSFARLPVGRDDSVGASRRPASSAY